MEIWNERRRAADGSEKMLAYVDISQNVNRMPSSTVESNVTVLQLSRTESESESQS